MNFRLLLCAWFVKKQYDSINILEKYDFLSMPSSHGPPRAGRILNKDQDYFP